ncbi:MAG: TRAP transporter substrate-binding protein [Acidobacteria bacterium]|nr:MAG: TRAP transporter substrate-binding protein [Acidobacteriota bacterium]
MHLHKASIIFLLACTVFSCEGKGGGGGAGEKIVLRVAHNGSVHHPHNVGFEKFKEVLEAETQGRVEVQIFPAEQLGTEEEASQMVKVGTIAATAAGAGGGLAPFVPEAELFNFPFLFRDLDHFYRVVDGPIGRRIGLAIEEALDCVVLGYWFSGVRNVWNSKKPILVPGDFAGLKIRVMSSPVLVETFNTLGAQATPMSFGELYSGLQQGVVDGAETDHIDLLYEKFYEVTEHVSYTNHLFLAVGLLFSRAQYDRLPADIQTAVLKAGRASVVAQRQAMETVTATALSELKDKGLQFHEVDRKLFQDKVQSVYANNADKVGGLEVIQQVLDQ